MKIWIEINFVGVGYNQRIILTYCLEWNVVCESCEADNWNVVRNWVWKNKGEDTWLILFDFIVSAESHASISEFLNIFVLSLAWPAAYSCYCWREDSPTFSNPLNWLSGFRTIRHKLLGPRGPRCATFETSHLVLESINVRRAWSVDHILGGWPLVMADEVENDNVDPMSGRLRVMWGFRMRFAMSCKHHNNVNDFPYSCEGGLRFDSAGRRHCQPVRMFCIQCLDGHGCWRASDNLDDLSRYRSISILLLLEIIYRAWRLFAARWASDRPRCTPKTFWYR